MRNKKTKIEVYVTRKHKWRARITPVDIRGVKLPAFEVTIGGKAWSEGKGKDYQTRIYQKMWELVGYMEQQCKNIVGNKLDV